MTFASAPAALKFCVSSLLLYLLGSLKAQKMAVFALIRLRNSAVFLYTKNHGFMHYFLHKSRDLELLGGFEPILGFLNSFILKAFRVCTPIPHQNRIVPLYRYYIIQTGNIKCCLSIAENSSRKQTIAPVPLGNGALSRVLMCFYYIYLP